MTGDGSRNMNYWVDFYSNDWKKDLSIEATLTDYGFVNEKFGELVIQEEPEFRIETVVDSEDLPYELSEEEKRRVLEILNNVYWNETLY